MPCNNCMGTLFHRICGSEINRIVYRPFALTPDEIALIESSVAE